MERNNSDILPAVDDHLVDNEDYLSFLEKMSKLGLSQSKMIEAIRVDRPQAKGLSDKQREFLANYLIYRDALRNVTDNSDNRQPHCRTTKDSRNCSRG